MNALAIHDKGTLGTDGTTKTDDFLEKFRKQNLDL